MTLEQMQEKKKRLGYTYQQIALLSGVPKTTVQKVLGGFTKNPRTNTMKALENALDSHELGEISEVRYTPLQKNVTSLREEALQYDADMYMEPTPRFHIVPEWAKNQKYPKQGSYTLADYLALPDGQRAELIEGVIYDMASTSAVHQDIQLDIAVALKEASKKHTECRVYTPPYDVQLNADDRTIVQPDVFVVCHKDRLSKKRVIGAPDLVIEVLSPSTRKKDIEIKYGEYARAEQGILALLFSDASLMEDMRRQLKPQDFSSPELGKMYGYASALYNTGRNITVAAMEPMLEPAELELLVAAIQTQIPADTRHKAMEDYIRVIQEQNVSANPADPGEDPLLRKAQLQRKSKGFDTGE